MSATAREIAERLCNKLYPAGDYWRVDEFTEIISSALESRERDVQELCDEVELISDFLVGYGDVAELASRRLRTALAKLRAGEQKGSE